MELRDPGPDAEEFRAIVRRYWQRARHLRKKYAIRREHRRELYITLDKAKLVFDGVQYCYQHKRHMVSQKEIAEEFRDAAKLAADLFPQLDPWIRTAITRKVDALTDNVFITHREISIGRMSFTSQLRTQSLATLLEILKEGADEGLPWTRRPDGNPRTAEPLIAMVGEFRTFWTDVLGRKFTELFAGDEHKRGHVKKHPKALPKNQASKFTFDAVRGLLGPRVEGSEVRYAMNQVKDARASDSVPEPARKRPRRTHRR